MCPYESRLCTCISDSELFVQTLWQYILNSEGHRLSPVSISTVHTEGPRPHHEEVGENVVQRAGVLCVQKMLWKECVHERHT